jgi:putative alpha-1,2-mannosidase
VEYSLCDFAISRVALGLDEKDISKKYFDRSQAWKNLWRDTIIDGTRGFIWPKDDNGKWLDSTQQVKFSNETWKFVKGKDLFTPKSFGWGWEDVFYEGNSQHYSLHLLHDIPSMIERSGGNLAFEKRLDTFFGKDGDYDVSNEPCFFTPVLYHYIGKPWKSNAVATQITESKYNSTPRGLPGNDDSGSMSSWYAFHAIGLYPNAGHDYYIITAPLFDEVRISNIDKPFVIKSKFKNPNSIYIVSAKLNGKPYNNAWIKHDVLVAGGVLELELSDKPTYNWGLLLPPQ